MSKIYFLTATELAEKIRVKEIGCLELLELYLDRVARYNSRINAVILLDEENARARAKEADIALANGKLWGPLHGVPMTMKESFDVDGQPSTWGSPEFKDNFAKSDAVVVARMKSAGVTLFGKTNVPFMLGDWQTFNEIYGTTNNPWDVSRTPGGSSGGSSAALASGLTGIEAGSDIGASIRNPAHYCGVFGHKPSMGVVPTTGYGLPGNNVPTDISVIGPLARGADDLDISLSLMSGVSGRDASGWSLDLPKATKLNLKDFRIGVLLEDSICAQDVELTDQLQSLVDRLSKLGVEVVDNVRPVSDTGFAHQIYLMMLRAVTGSRLPEGVLREHLSRANRSDPADFSYQTIVDRAYTLTHKEWLMLNEQRELLCREWANYFKEYDLLLTPMAASVAFPHDYTGQRGSRTILVNGKEELAVDQLFWAGLPSITYLPATCAPAGFTRSGLPCGIQIIGPYLHDLTTIHFARLIEKNIGGFIAPEGYD